MFAKDRTTEHVPTEVPCAIAPRELELARLRRNLYVSMLLFATVLVASLTGCTYLLLKPFIIWTKTLPQGVEPTWDKLMQDTPGVFYTSIAAGIVGAALAAVGLGLLLRLLGRHNWPPKKVVLGLLTVPLLLGVALIGTALNSVPDLGTGLMLPLMLGYGCAIVPIQLGLSAAGQTSIALNQLRQRPNPIESASLPAGAAEYLNQLDADALEAGLTPLGDYSYLPHWKKYRRYWMAPNGAYFVDATWCTTGNSTLSAASVSSATSDGHYFETVDQPAPPGAPTAHAEGLLTHVTYLPGEPLAVLLEKHVEIVGEWVEHAGCRPLEFATAELHSFTNYGIAAFMRETRSDVLWLGNPYAGQPLPPLPGRPWQPDVALVPLR